MSRTPQLQDALDSFVKATGMSACERATLDEGGTHDGTCSCSVCWGWWRMMGRDPATGQFGPFGASLGSSWTAWASGLA